MRLSQARIRRDASFDLTPMIDVVLFLIIFFSMTSQFTETQRAPMALPRQRGDREATESAMSLVIDMHRDGSLHVMGRPYDDDGIADLLARHATPIGGGPGPLDVVVRADRACMTVHLDELARTLADAGIVEWKLATTGTRGPNP